MNDCQLVRRHLLVMLALSLLLNCFCSQQPGHCTKLPADLSDLVLSEFPGAKIRLDGAVDTGRGELFLPLAPTAAKKHGKAQLVSSHPSPEKPDVLVYANGWCFVRVLKRGKAKTIVVPAELPDKLRKQLLTCRFPSDLIVPESFSIPASFKPIVGETAVQMLPDATISASNFGQAPARSSSTGVAAGPGSFFLTSLSSGTITLLDEQSLSKIADFPTEGTPCSMAWAEDRLYITDQAKNRVLMLDPVGRRFLGQIDLPLHSAPRGIVALPNGRLIYVAESGSNDVAVIETASGAILLRTKVAPGPSRMAVTPNGNFLIVLNVPSGLVTFISTLNQKVLSSVRVGEVPTAIAVTKDSAVAYVSNRGSNSVSILDLTIRQVTGTIATGSGPTGLELSADGSKLYVANAKDNTIGVYDTKTNEKISEVKLPIDVDFPNAIDLMPDGKRLLVSSESTDTVASLELSTMEFDKQTRIGHSSHDIIWVPVR